DRPPRPDARGLRRNRRVAHPARPGVSLRTEGQAGAGAHAVHHRLLRHVAGASDVGADFGDLPQPRARAGGLDCGLGAVDRLLRIDVHLPRAQSDAGSVRHVLALRGHLLRRVHLRQALRPRDAGSQPRRDRARSDCTQPRSRSLRTRGEKARELPRCPFPVRWDRRSPFVVCRVLETHDRVEKPMWGRLATCAAVGYRRRSTAKAAGADCQSAAGYQPAPQNLVRQPDARSVFHGISRAEGPFKRTTQGDGLSHQGANVVQFRRCPCTNRKFRRAWRDALSSPWPRPFPQPWRRPNRATGPTSRPRAIPTRTSWRSTRASPNTSSLTPSSTATTSGQDGRKGRRGARRDSTCCGATFPTTGNCASRKRTGTSACSGARRATATGIPSISKAGNWPASTPAGAWCATSTMAASP